MPIKKYAPWVVGAFVVFYLVQSPETAAQTVQSAAGGLASVADSLARFVNELA